MRNNLLCALYGFLCIAALFVCAALAVARVPTGPVKPGAHDSRAFVRCLAFKNVCNR